MCFGKEMAGCEVGWSKEELENISLKTEGIWTVITPLSSLINPTEMLGY